MKRATRTIEEELMRLLHGELPSAEAVALRQRVAREPELAAAYERMGRSWEALDLPRAPGVPPGFANRVMARAVRLPRPGGISWATAPAWVRATAAACLLAGAAAGAGLGVHWTESSALTGAPEIFGVAEAEASESLTESYWGEVADSSLGEAEATAPVEGGEIGEAGPLAMPEGPGGAGEGAPL